MVFAEEALGIGARRVEIAQRHRADAIRPLEMRQRPLDRELGLAVGIDRPLRMAFGDRRLDGIPERGRGGREDQVRDLARDHRPQHGQRAADVVLVIADRILDRLPHRQPRREVHDGIDAVSGEDLAEAPHVLDVPLLERGSRRVGGRLVPGAEIVEDDDVLPGGAQRFDRVAANVARAPRDEHAHRRPIDR